MKAPLTLIGAFVLASCSEEATRSPLPNEADLSSLEAKLARHPCVGDLQIWERSYRFLRTPRMLEPDHIDFSVIEFHFRRAGMITVVPGHNVFNPDDSENWPDSPAVQALSGRYSIKSGALNMARCRPLSQSPSVRGS